MNAHLSKKPEEHNSRLILLNEFRSDVWKRRCAGNSNLIEFRDKFQSRQLQRSRKLLKHIEHSVKSKTLDFVNNA